MHEAAQRGETRQLQQLIESGACVNQVTVDSITPLHAASLQGQVQCVQLLLAAGAQVSHPMQNLVDFKNQFGIYFGTCVKQISFFFFSCRTLWRMGS